MNIKTLYQDEIHKLKKVPQVGRDKRDYWKQIVLLLIQRDTNFIHGNWAEFGTRNGESARILAKHLPEKSLFYLFDSFEGLPEDWDKKDKKGSMKVESIPKFDNPRFIITKGWFEETLKPWVNDIWNQYLCDNGDKDHSFFSLFHIDCDLYSSTRTVLEAIDSLISPDTYLLLDDYCNGTDKHREHVFRAFQEFILTNSYKYRIIYRSFSGSQVTVKVEKPK